MGKRRKHLQYHGSPPAPTPRSPASPRSHPERQQRAGTQPRVAQWPCAPGTVTSRDQGTRGQQSSMARRVCRRSRRMPVVPSKHWSSQKRFWNISARPAHACALPEEFRR